MAAINWCSAVFVGILALQLCFTRALHATLKFYYDPLTGNVSFDTSDTRGGTLAGYTLALSPTNTPFQFNSGNMVHLSDSTYFDQRTDQIGEYTFGTPWQGLYTIGNILPTGLSDQYWSSMFVPATNPRNRATNDYAYVDIVGGAAPPNAEFIYGRPSGEFKNKWDLIDPDTLKWASTAKLIYNPVNGEVFVDTTAPTSGYIASLLLQSVGKFLPAGYEPFIAGPYNSASSSTISLFSDAIEPGFYSIGEILPAGLTRSQFENDFTSAKFMGRAGFAGKSFDFDTYGVALQLEYMAVPEPHALRFLAALMLVTFPCRVFS